MLNDALLEAFMLGFFGYGNWKAKYWFVGMEEGVGKGEDEIARRLDTWDKHGRPDIDDIRSFHRDAGLYDWFGAGSPLQATWGAFIPALLIAERRDSSTGSVVEYQRSSLGASNGETAVIEVLPLPSRSKQEWNYAKWSRLTALRDRKTYEAAYTPKRRDRLLNSARLYNPPVIVFYGNRADWSSRMKLKPLPPFQTNAGKWRDSLVIATDHPNARTNDAPARFAAIGHYLAQNL